MIPPVTDWHLVLACEAWARRRGWRYPEQPVDHDRMMCPSCAMPWPYSIPAGLRRRIDSVLGLRNHGAAEIWGEVRDWLEENGVEMPEGISVEAPPEGGAQRDQ